MQYARSVRVGILKKVLPPENQSIRSVSKDTGICEQTIRNWIQASKSGSFEKDTDEKSPRNLCSREKYQLLMEASRIPNEKLGEFLRERGLHSEYLTLWDQEFREMAKNKDSKKDQELKNLRKKVKSLEKELNRKEKALAEAAALLVLKKKLDALMGDPEED